MSEAKAPKPPLPPRQPDKKNGCSTGVFCVLVAVAFLFLLAFAFILWIQRILEEFQA